MKRIFNPWEGMEGYHCYGCDPHSPQGLRMEFYEDGDDIVSVWKPRPEFQGWVDTLHGGIQATLADEISSWVVFRKFQTSGVTSRMEVRYHKPIRSSCGPASRSSGAISSVSPWKSATCAASCAPRPSASISCFLRRRPAGSFISAIAASGRTTGTRWKRRKVDPSGIFSYLTPLIEPVWN